MNQYDDDLHAPPAPPEAPVLEPGAPPEAPANDREALLAEQRRIAALLAQTPANQDEPFTRAEWGGHELFQCKRCPWTTFDETAAYEHQTDATYATAHRANQAAAG